MESDRWECEKADDEKLVACVVREMQRVNGTGSAGGERAEEAGRR